jgi:4-hydroxy-tetrahydrodipicolinate synthase
MGRSLVALITPFDLTGQVDLETLRELVFWHIDEGTDGLVLFGSTGEGIALSDEEKIDIISLCLETAQGKIPIFAASGFADTRHSVSFTQKMKELGIDGSLIITPYYNRPTQRGCLAHFQALAEVGLPLIVYHHPFRTAFRFTLESIIELSKMPNIIGLKESTHDLSFIQTVHDACNIPIFAGDDDMTLDILKLGGVGAISVIGNLFPREWKEMITLCSYEKWDSAKLIVDLYTPLINALSLEPNPQCVKYAMHLLGKSTPCLRLPLVTPEKKTQEILEAVLRAHCIPRKSEHAFL